MRSPERRLEYFWMSIVFFITLVTAAVSVPLSAVLDSALVLSLPAVLFLLGTVYTHLLYRSWSFEVRDDHVYLERGVITKVTTMVPYVRIQNVDTQKGPLERIFGISRVVVFTAGSRGSDVSIKGLFPEDAAEIQEKLRDFAVESDDRDAV